MISFDLDRGGAGLSSIYARPLGDIAVSFEFFPARNAKAAADLQAAVARLVPAGPSFMSVTYGAGGTTRDCSLATVEALLRGFSVPVAAHLTCAGASRAEVDAQARQFHAAGVRHIVALRGDGAEPGAPFTPHPDGYRNAAELVAGLTRIAPFEISVAAYPEVHPDALSAEADLDNLKRKLDAGATRALTQFFFTADAFLRFRDRAAAAGITAPIVPGILPVTNFAQTCKFARQCGAEVPGWMADLFAGLDQMPETRQLVAATLAAELCSQLYAGGVREFHFYTLNRADMTAALCHLLGRRAGAVLEQAA
ncbi:methylenetetrahydrofolate reductase [NAD(P)H] [Alteraurantiacibacter palmitatis]|uniref:Methylenetetrahydrofolate reductase n=1 Tax=Alteraurantiacibacter palmitatis TaxID=2054628 RepID=A0ABV7E1D6_9SPHN